MPPWHRRMSDLTERLRSIRRRLGLSQDAASERFSLGIGGWKRLEGDGRAPKDDVLTELALLGIDLNWLLTGQGQMLTRPDDLSPAPSGMPADASRGLDHQLLNTVAAEIEAVYRSENSRVSGLQLVRLAGKMCADLLEVGGSEEEMQGALKLALHQLRRDLREPADDNSGKRSA